ncbi:hypothetical protein N7532_010965 [Penicillium argentinense]|uniref:ER-bound oxygenase mpaB/mpaB'/Rubber oxygenase catalytic domain-containing protein n=1 Tax=Penicillium argentinense TaxID=1131581 RepID=A0A9W9EQS4_9EURO|nr:uncharacterized protein N7532_010965 [Penicillium argentinense]KAJ5086194.1 hypothetical protein N7532_010965 [Penicillium argentinense]
MSNENSSNEVVDSKMLDALDKPQQIHQVVQEAILLAGGAAAILLQVAEPGVAQGVDEHSNFAYRPLDRLRTTMTYVYCMVFGTREEKEVVIEMVHRAHATVNGPGYSANDPRLQLWVAATLYAVGMDLYQQMFGKFDNTTSEAIYREYSVLALSLRVPPGMWPVDRKAFWEYWNYQVATMEITDHAKHVAKDLLHNKRAPIQIRMVLPLVRLTTTYILPERIREAYGLRSTKLRRGAYRVTMGLTKATYPSLPRAIRTYPMKYYLKDMRQRLKGKT